ncbi:hypothetical protein ACKF11_13255 [Methylobacillus sp. Pita2]|uniref:hypothetical protein n=1 Tax=Methylobacillus sp. Pita2 TaxID=3383245 RepID=UPI0038B46BEB
MTTTNLEIESDQPALPVAWQGEMMLTAWSDTSRNGRTATFRLAEDDAEHPFRSMATQNGKTPGQRYMVVMVLLDDQETPVKEAAQKPFGAHAKQLHISGWFFNRKVVTAIGSTADYDNWLRKQPCAICKAPAPSLVRTGKNYASIGVCNQHLHTHETALASYLPRLLKKWVDYRLCQELGTDSLGNVNPNYLRGLCRKLGIEDTLPASYFDPH